MCGFSFFQSERPSLALVTNKQVYQDCFEPLTPPLDFNLGGNRSQEILIKKTSKCKCLQCNEVCIVLSTLFYYGHEPVVSTSLILGLYLSLFSFVYVKEHRFPSYLNAVGF